MYPTLTKQRKMSSRFVLKTCFSKNELINLWNQYHFQPSKSLGQNFLVDAKVAEETVKALELDSSDIVYEIGPGCGSLTCLLVPKAKKVTVIEKDKQLVDILKNLFQKCPNLEIIEGDILKFLSLPHPQGKFIGNPPYYLSSPLLRQLLSIKPRPETIVLTLQKELGEKIIAQPPRANHLSVFVQLTSQVKIIGPVNRQSFWPVPAVDSLLLEIRPSKLPLSVEATAIIKLAFSTPRKTLLNGLCSRSGSDRNKIRLRFAVAKLRRDKVRQKIREGELRHDEIRLRRDEIRLALLEAGINPESRPGVLQLEEWKKLFKLFSKKEAIFKEKKIRYTRIDSTF